MLTRSSSEKATSARTETDEGSVKMSVDSVNMSVDGMCLPGPDSQLN